MHRLARTTMSATNTPIVVILGATGAGKSQLALELAVKFGGEIISADAMQMYRGLDIVTNKVTMEEQKLVKHHMINILDPLSINNVVDFRNKALPVVEKLLGEGKMPVICGGTCYYIESLLWKVLVDETLPLIIGGKREHQREREEGGKCSKISENHGDDTNTDSELEGSIEGLESVNNFPSTDVPLSISKISWSEDPGLPPTPELYSLLQSVDPARASVLHPKERRKIWRSLQVFSQHGVPHSQLLEQQEGNTVGMGGGLRFGQERICIIEVWSDQEVLDTRCDKRVEKMLARGLVKELQEFHTNFNKLRAEEGDLAQLDYDKGIWQSIGFKEFHNYLCLGDEEREGEEGKRLFKEGVERMKISTRQYSRKQMKWIRKRFLLNTRNPPPVYRVNSTDPTQWQEMVYIPAEVIVKDFIEGRKPEMEPLERIESGKDREEDCRKTMHCDICDRDFKGSVQFKNHQKSASHRKVSRAVLDKYHYEVVLTSFKEEDRNGVAKIIKNTFSVGLTDVFMKMDSLPSVVGTVVGKGKADSIARELSKQGIVVEMEKKILVKAENSLKAETG